MLSQNQNILLMFQNELLMFQGKAVKIKLSSSLEMPNFAATEYSACGSCNESTLLLDCFLSQCRFGKRNICRKFRFMRIFKVSQ
jgi:hypothetical protein